MRAYLTRRRPLLRWLTALALFFAVYLTVRTSRAAMNWLCGGVIFPVMRRISRLCDFFDGSVGEVLLTDIPRRARVELSTNKMHVSSGVLGQTGANRHITLA